MPQSLKHWVWLSSIPGLGAVRCNQLLNEFGSPESIWNAELPELRNLTYLNEALAAKLVDKSFRCKAEAHMDNINNKNIRIIHINHENYPDYLKNIYDPPVVLYVRGELKQEKAIAVVGSRRATSYGLNTAERISYELVKYGITVVSGMARGVDSYAHNGALNAGGRTIAVLGCGPDIVYPPENSYLMDKIIENGAIVSEFIPGYPPLPQNFPARNRIISGISQGVVIVEANEKSGSLITANFALEQGREVFAVPGNVTSNNSKGTNLLIKDGAKMVTGVDDILEELNFFDLNEEPYPVNSDKNKNKFKHIYKNMTDEEKKIIDCLDLEPLHIDAISSKSGLSMQTVNAILVILELQGILEQLPGKIFKLIN